MKKTCIQTSSCTRETYIFSASVVAGREHAGELSLAPLIRDFTGCHGAAYFKFVEVIVILLETKGWDVNPADFVPNMQFLRYSNYKGP